MKITSINNTPLQKQQSFEGKKGYTFTRGLTDILKVRFGEVKAFELLRTAEAQKFDRAVFDAHVIQGDKQLSPMIQISRTAEGADTFTIDATVDGVQRSINMNPSELVDSPDCFEQLRLKIETPVALLGRSDEFVRQEQAAKAFVRNPESTATAELREERHMAPQEKLYED